MCREFTTIEHNEPLQKRSLKRSMVVPLMIEGNCSTFGSKPAHLVGHLPYACMIFFHSFWVVRESKIVYLFPHDYHLLFLIYKVFVVFPLNQVSCVEYT